MRNIIISSIFLLLFTTGAAAQSITNEVHNKSLEKLSDNLYSVTYTTDEGQVLQTGQYWLEGERYIPHGIWTLHCSESGNVVTRTEFLQGKQLWIETTIDGKKVLFDEKQLAIKDLKKEIEKLENRLAALEKSGT